MTEDDLAIDLTRIIAERKIKEAMDEGVFDNLLGKGKPLIIEDDSHTPAHLRSAHRIMRNAGVAPEWILLEKEIAATKADAQNIYELAKSRTASGNFGGIDSLREDYRRTMKEANDMILKYNITMPFVHSGPIPFRIKERLAAWDENLIVPDTC
jgi:hypothetical protein